MPPSYRSKERTVVQAAERTHTQARLLTTPGQRAKQWAKLWAWLQRLGPGPGHSLVPSRLKRAVLAAGKPVEQIGKEQNQAAQDAVSLGKSSLAGRGWSLGSPPAWTWVLGEENGVQGTENAQWPTSGRQEERCGITLPEGRPWPGILQ